MATLLGRRSKAKDKPREEEPGGQMSFLDHLDELRRRIIRCVIFVFVAFFGCWFVSDHIYNFLAIPVQRALAEAQRHQVDISGLKGDETIQPFSTLKENDTGRYVFNETIRLGTSAIPPGASVLAKIVKIPQDPQGRLGLYTAESLYSGNTVIPPGVRLPVDLNAKP